MSKMYYIRAQVVGGLPSGQKVVKLLANNADGIELHTDARHLLTPEDLRQRKGTWQDIGPFIACQFCGFHCEDLRTLGRANFCPDCGARLKSAKYKRRTRTEED